MKVWIHGPWPRPFCVELAYSFCVCVGLLWALQFLPTVQSTQVRLTAETRLRKV
uniref:Uncharacterized protein n=1 Tax=Anguilla anguilla TaxID=7936 RepID=A0A0E9SXM8_ANGAN